MKVQKQSGKKGKKLNKAWLNDHLNDPYVKMATRDGYRARAAYKLKEMDETLGLIKPGMTVVDLGSAPGAWSQYLRRKLSGTEGANMTGSNRVIAADAKTGAASGALSGRIIALDILPMPPVEDVTFILGDLREESVLPVSAKSTAWFRTWRLIYRAWNQPMRRGCVIWLKLLWSLPSRISRQKAR
jgi:23S rRNA (uridine2552-2'-O)-methyltransferase